MAKFKVQQIPQRAKRRGTPGKVMLYLGIELGERVKGLAKQNQISEPQFIKQCVEYALANMDEK